MKVLKFGGSSLADSTQFAKVKQIVEADDARRFVVVSAVGKSAQDPHKITDLLYLCHAHLKYGVSCDQLFAQIAQRFLAIKKALKLTYPIEKDLDLIQASLRKQMPLDYLVSRGEYLTAKLMANYLNYTFLDAKDFLRFAYDGKVDFVKTAELLEHQIAKHDRFVIPGFYGAMPDGSIRIMARGGSDITGAILAQLVQAEVYENWTDVSGILMADPRIIEEPRQIQRITYSELRELSYMGADVLHEDAIFPVKEANIPIHIRNTNDPMNPGTLIMELNDETLRQSDSLITGIAGRKDFSVVAIYKNHMSNEVGIIRRALSVFEQFHISVEHIPSGIDSFSVVVNQADIKDCVYELVAQIKAACECDQVRILHDIALIATVGRHMSARPGISGQLFAQLGQHGINIRMIAQGSDEINIIVGVDNRDFERTIRVIYAHFVETKQEVQTKEDHEEPMI
ncbi:MAG: aspartate kinase [Erysipelotrichaceae bacterium]|nr:aspartate kinase [Erysipelotrichaceae bacterium]